MLSMQRILLSPGDLEMSANTTTSDSKMDARDRGRILKILESNWQAEMRGYHTYEILAKRETDPSRRAAFRTLAHAEHHHAQLWGDRIRALGGPDRPGLPRAENRRGGYLRQSRRWDR